MRGWPDEPGEKVEDFNGDQTADHAAGWTQRRRRRSDASPLIDRAVEKRILAAVTTDLALIASGFARNVERSNPRDRREVAHRDVGDSPLEAGPVAPMLDHVRRPVGGVNHQVGAGDAIPQGALRVDPGTDCRDRDRRVEAANPLGGALGLEHPDLALFELDLAVQIAELD